MNDRFTIRAVVLFLGATCLFGQAAGTFLAYCGIKAPEFLSSISVAAVGAIAGILANTRHGGLEDPVAAQIVGGQSGMGSDVETASHTASHTAPHKFRGNEDEETEDVSYINRSEMADPAILPPPVPPGGRVQSTRRRKPTDTN